MATFMKRKGRYTARVRRGGHPTQTKTFDRLSYARRWATKTEHLIDAGNVITQDCTLNQLLTRYAAEVTPHKRGAKIEAYRLGVIQRHSICDLWLSKLTSGHIAQYRDERLRQVGASACNRDLSIISHAIRIAMSEWGFNLPGNPAANLRKPPQPKGRTRRLEGDEEARLMMSCQASSNPFLQPLVVLAIETAMRRGELLSLRWDHVELNKSYVHLPMTKNGDSRDVPLSPKARQTMEALPRSLSGVVIPIHPEALKGLWNRATRRADITGLRFHDLRHEATTRLFEKGLGMMEVAAITGHKDLRMLQRYVQLRPEDLARKLA
ncbi:MAG: site-specific integrase [Alphaproteobacteria bacterium]